MVFLTVATFRHEAIASAAMYLNQYFAVGSQPLMTIVSVVNCSLGAFATVSLLLRIVEQMMTLTACPE